MNIFVTGMNPADANNLKRAPRVAIFQAFVEEMKYLQDSGENLTWRRHRVGDRFPAQTDAVVVSSMLPRSLNCPYALGAIWAMEEAVRLDIPLVIHLTDWAFFKAHNEFKSIAKAGQPYFSKQIGGTLQYNEDPTAIKECGEQLIDLCRQWGDPSSKLWKHAQIAAPMYTHWGDEEIIQRLMPGANPVFKWDPTPLFVRYLGEGRSPVETIPTLELRRREWILPSLLKNDDWLDKQGLKWKVTRFGPKGFDVLPTERDIHREYRCAVGAICPPYPTVGSGWWRTRWIHSALAGSVLFCDSRDGVYLGPAFTYSGRMYEAMNWKDLQDVADYQSTTMRSFLQMDEARLVDQLYAPFKAAGL